MLVVELVTKGDSRELPFLAIYDDLGQKLSGRFVEPILGRVVVECLLPITGNITTLCVKHTKPIKVYAKLYRSEIVAQPAFARASQHIIEISRSLPILKRAVQKQDIKYIFYKFVPEIVPFPDGSRKLTGKTLRTPYMVDVELRNVICSSKMASDQSVSARVFWLCHEIFGHLYHDCDGSQSGEIKADEIALHYYTGMGFGESEAYLAVNDLIAQLERIVEKEPQRTSELKPNMNNLIKRRDIIAAKYGI